MHDTKSPGLNPHRSVLSNGMAVWLDPFDADSTVAWRLSIRAGGAQDPPGRSGTAHLLEHMLANKGSRRVGTLDWAAEAPILDRVRHLSQQAAEAPDAASWAAAGRALDAAEAEAWPFAVPNELKQAAGALGGRGFNAATSLDRTGYRVDLPPNRIAAWAQLEADRFAHPVMRGFGTELSTVCEELRRAWDQPGRAMAFAWAEALWGEHPYGRPVLGRAEELERAQVAQMEDYLRTWMRPSNMALCLSGPIDLAATLALLEDTLGQLPDPGGPLPADPPVPAPLSGERRIAVQHEADDECLLAWATAPRAHPDQPALRLLDELLGNGATGLLSVSLVHSQRVRAAGSFRQGLRQAGMQAVWARPRAWQDPAEMAALLLTEIDRIKDQDFDPDELLAIARNISSNDERALERSESRAAWLVRAWTYGEAWPDAGRPAAGLLGVSPADVAAVAQRYLGPDRVLALRRRGPPAPVQVAPPATTPRPPSAEARSAFVDAVLALPAPPLAVQSLAEGVDYHRADAPFGAHLHVPNPCNRLCHLELRWELGTDAHRGLGAAFGLWGIAGVAGLDHSALQHRLFALGLGMGWRVGQRSLSVQLGGRSDDLDEGLDLLFSRLEGAPVSAAERARHLADLLRRRQDRKAQRDVAIDALNQWALEGEGSRYRGRSLGDAELSDIVLQGELSEWLSPLRRTRGALRSLSASGAAAAVQALAARWTPTDAPPERAPERHLRPAQDRVLVVDRPGAQASLHLLQPTSPERLADAPVRALVQELYSGAGGLFFQEVREARGWAYSVRGALSTGSWPDDDSLRWATAATAPERCAAAATLMRDLLRRDAVDPSRFARAQAAAIAALQAHRVSFRSIAGVVESWRRLGHPADPRPQRLATIAAATAADAEAWLARESAAPMTVAIVGERARLDLGALEKIGPVSVLNEGDLFSF